MTEINIARHIDKLMIFDDPEYCEGAGSLFGSNKCESLHLNLCGRFEDDDGHIVSLFLSNHRTVKCPQCKEVYQRDRIFGESSLLQDESGKPYIDPMHPERGAY